MYRNYGDLEHNEPTNVLDVVNDEHIRHIIQTNRVVVVDIYSTRCEPCKLTAPDYAKIASDYSRPGECAIVKYDYDKLNPSDKVQIRRVPTFQFYVNGQKQADSVVGADINKVRMTVENILQSVNNQNVMSGPNFSKNSIRNTRTGIPQIPEDNYRPSNFNTGPYYQTNM